MKAKTILFTVIALLFLAGGVGCEKNNDNQSSCYYCAQSDFIKKVDNVDGVVVYYEEIERFIISINEDDIKKIDVKEWNSMVHSSESIYIPYVDLPKRFKKNGLKVNIIEGDLYTCYPIVPRPEYQIRFMGDLLMNYKIEPAGASLHLAPKPSPGFYTAMRNIKHHLPAL